MAHVKKIGPKTRCLLVRYTYIKDTYSEVLLYTTSTRWSSLIVFLTPDDEVVEDEDDDIFISVVEHYSIDKLGEEDPESSDEEEVEEIDTAVVL